MKDTSSLNSKAVQVVLIVVLAMIVAEALLYPSQNSVPNGVFSLAFGDLNVRAVDLGFLAIFIVTVATRRVYRSNIALLITTVIATLMVALSWALVSQAEPGLGTLLTESRWLIYLLCLWPTTGRITLDEFSLVAARALRITLPFIALAVVLDLIGRPIAVPLFFDSDFGSVGGDLATVVSFLAILATAKSSNWWLLMLLLPLLTDQRAAILASSVIGLAGVVLIYRSEIRSWLGSHRGALALGIGLIAVPVTALTTFPLWRRFAIEAATELFGTFTDEGKVASAATRPYQLAQAWQVFERSPVVGLGTGNGPVEFYDQYAGSFVETGSAHNFVADIALRWGLIGFACIGAVFLVAFLGDRRHRSLLHSTAVLALTTVMAKALLEPAFDKYRLAAIIAMGVIAVAGRSRAANVASERLGQPLRNSLPRKVL